MIRHACSRAYVFVQRAGSMYDSNVAPYLIMLTDGGDSARWSPYTKGETVCVDLSGKIATKTDENFGYAQTEEAVSQGVHTW